MIRTLRSHVLSYGAALLATAATGTAQSTALVSADSNGVPASGGHSQECVISANGRFVAFKSYASDLVPNDSNTDQDVFVRDLLTGTTERVSVSSSGAQTIGGGSYTPAISDDGRFVAFRSGAINLVANDSNNCDDVFVRDRVNGTTELISVSTVGVQGIGYSGDPSISADGRYVAFISPASNFVTGDNGSYIDVFVRDRLNGTTERVSVDSNGLEANANNFSPSISGDGVFVAFSSDASNLVPGDTNGVADVFVYDRQWGTTTRESLDWMGVAGDGVSRHASLSGDGRLVAFESVATNLVAGDTNGTSDVFVHDRQTGTTERVSVAASGTQADGGSYYPVISPDGRFVAFMGDAQNLVANDTNQKQDVFLRDRQFGTTQRASVDSVWTQGNENSYRPSISADGRLVVFYSAASNLVGADTNSVEDVFLRDCLVSPPVAFCFGDGSGGLCPCGNNGSTGRGCENSASTGGAVLTATGTASIVLDTLVLTSTGELSIVPSIFLQGTATVAPVNFGDGLRCTGGALKRLYVLNASGGVVSAPQVGAPSISARSASLGDVLIPAMTRYYQTYYRDPALAFCPNPPGNSWNISSGLSVAWDQ